MPINLISFIVGLFNNVFVGSSYNSLAVNLLVELPVCFYLCWFLCSPSTFLYQPPAFSFFYLLSLQKKSRNNLTKRVFLGLLHHSNKMTNSFQKEPFEVFHFLFSNYSFLIKVMEPNCQGKCYIFVSLSL